MDGEAERKAWRAVALAVARKARKGKEKGMEGSSGAPVIYAPGAHVPHVLP